MVTTRTPISRGKRSKITLETIEAHRHARELYDSDAIDEWEEDGGRRTEYLDACLELHRLLRREPWQEDVIDTIDCDEPPGWMGRDRIDDWRRAAAIRVELENARL